MTQMDINLPDVHAEVTAVVARDEHALANNHSDVIHALLGAQGFAQELLCHAGAAVLLPGGVA